MLVLQYPLSEITRVWQSAVPNAEGIEGNHLLLHFKHFRQNKGSSAPSYLALWMQTGDK